MIWILLQGHFCPFPLVIWNNSWGRERSKQKLAWWPYLYCSQHPWLPVRVSNLILSAFDHAVISTRALCHVLIKVAGVHRTAAQPRLRQSTHRKWNCVCHTEVNEQGSLSWGTSPGVLLPQSCAALKGGWGYTPVMCLQHTCALSATLHLEHPAFNYPQVLPSSLTQGLT